jgi:hypothetical protein
MIGDISPNAAIKMHPKITADSHKEEEKKTGGRDGSPPIEIKGLELTLTSLVTRS